MILSINKAKKARIRIRAFFDLFRSAVLLAREWYRIIRTLE